MAGHTPYDLVIVGAGIHGLVMVKTYLDVNPAAKVLVLESAATVGGTWSAERLYPGLKSNNIVGSYEYSDFPIDPKFGLRTGDHIPGPVLHQYFLDYLAKFDLASTIRTKCRVEALEKLHEGGWKVHYSDDGTTKQLQTAKVVISTGLTSKPFLPVFKGQETFGSPIFHAKNLLQNANLMEEAKNVIILGGSKSAFDCAYALASKGVTVDWIIRESGHGTNWMSPVYVTPLKKRLEGLVGVRFLSWFSPCIWGDEDGFGWIRRLLHGTVIGRFLVDTFWKILHDDVVTLTGYNKSPEMAKLKPRIPPFWHAGSLSILNYDTDIFEYVRNGTIKVHIKDISHLSRKTVHLTDGSTLSGDALICSTGWDHRPAIKFLPDGLEAELGLPNSADPEPQLIMKADHEILTEFPRLKNQPHLNEKYIPLQSATAEQVVPNRPFRLYRFMAPPRHMKDHSIAFLGMIITIHTTTCAQAQALWITAYLDGKLPQQKQGLLDADEIAYQTVLQSQFGKWRYPAGFGRRYPDFVFDAVPYIDMLLRDLGLKFRRKSGWFSELFDPYGPQDYVGLVDEWIVQEAKSAARNG